MNPISGSGFERFIRDPTAKVQHPLGKAGMVVLNALFGIATLGIVHIGFAIKHHFTTKRAMMNQAQAALSLEITGVGLPLLIKKREIDAQLETQHIPRELIVIIHSQIGKIAPLRQQAIDQKKLHMYTLTDSHTLLISEKGQLFLENLSKELGHGTFKTAYEARDLTTGEELVSLHYKEEEKKDIPVPPSREKVPVKSAVEAEENEERTSGSFAGEATSGPRVASQGLTKAPSGLLAMMEEARKKQRAELPPPPQGTAEQNERGAHLGELNERQRELAVIRDLQGRPGIVQTRAIVVYDSQGAAQQKMGLLQSRYADDLSKLERPEDTASPLVKAEDRLKRMEILAGALDGLQAMHARGYIHRDIKPGNIMVRTASGTVEGALSDFGTVCLQHNDREIMNYAGTPRFSAPELAILATQHEKGVELTTQSDIWSMGVTMYQTLCEQPESEMGVAGQKSATEQLLSSIFGIRSMNDAAILPGIARLHPSRYRPGVRAPSRFSKSDTEVQDGHTHDLVILREKGALEHLVADCLELNPANRPTAAQLHARFQVLVAQQRQQVEALRAGRG